MRGGNRHLKTEGRGRTAYLRGRPRYSGSLAATGAQPWPRGARREVAAHARSRARCTLGRFSSLRPHSASSAQGPLAAVLEAREGGAGSARWRQETLKEIDDVYEKYKKEDDSNQKKRLQQHLQRALINSQELGDEKIQIVTQMLELVENRARQMELHSQCFQDPAESERASDKSKMDSSQPERSSRRPRRQRTSESRDLCHMTNGIDDCDDQPPKEKKSKSAKKKKRSKAKQEREASPVEFAIDPNEPTYCLCNQVSYGEMIGCDNEQCPIEWFHFSCVSLTYKPKGKWYCPKCRGDSEKTMDKSTEKTRKERRAR
ncbi:inhibitor of growth protein 2 isoform X1 [Rattus norvegicus]|uniref:Inhibitor of growth protein n=1 Tax=Rattus norvegicus TaxID=10116 RepID=A0ABK0LJX1_RAT|nr:inhibitor of growth protein 2 isoform X1 [Rattus norvegicus]|eukprot:XP_006253193.1 PREDICTED: inhibitor of growth protein 2 isoform X1 [Rattus norvegicus]